MVLPGWVTDGVNIEIGLFAKCDGLPVKCETTNPAVRIAALPALPLTIAELGQQDLDRCRSPHHYRVRMCLPSTYVTLCSLILLGIGCIVALASLCSYRFIRSAKYITGLSNLFLILGIILIPLGSVLPHLLPDLSVFLSLPWAWFFRLSSLECHRA
jgi:hypothetical protein